MIALKKTCKLFWKSVSMKLLKARVLEGLSPEEIQSMIKNIIWNHEIIHYPDCDILMMHPFIWNIPLIIKILNINCTVYKNEYNTLRKLATDNSTLNKIEKFFKLVNFPNIPKLKNSINNFKRGPPSLINSYQPTTNMKIIGSINFDQIKNRDKINADFIINVCMGVGSVTGAFNYYIEKMKINKVL